MLSLLLPYPAALVEADGQRTVVIADPHIGWENALQEKGIHVPSQTPRILNKLITLLDQQKPDALLITGDVKFTVVKSEMGEWHDIPDFFNEILRHVSEVSVIRGNHDANLEPLLPQSVSVLPASGVVVGDIGLFHGHKWPSPVLLKCKTLVMGHVHPTVMFRDPSGYRLSNQVWVKAKCDSDQLAKTLLKQHGVKLDGTAVSTVKKHFGFAPISAEVVIMPSFNDFLGGRAMNETRPGKEGQATMIGPMLRSGILDLDNAEIYLLDGTFLGTLDRLRRI